MALLMGRGPTSPPSQPPPVKEELAPAPSGANPRPSSSARTDATPASLDALLKSADDASPSPAMARLGSPSSSKALRAQHAPPRARENHGERLAFDPERGEYK